MRAVDDGDDDADLGERPSRSARKRLAEGLQKLGVRLVGLREADLQTLALPEPLLEAIREARRLRGPAIARQNQYIGRLMRDIDPEPIERALSRVTAPGRGGARVKVPK